MFERHKKEQATQKYWLIIMDTNSNYINLPFIYKAKRSYIIVLVWSVQVIHWQQTQVFGLFLSIKVTPKSY